MRRSGAMAGLQVASAILGTTLAAFADPASNAGTPCAASVRAKTGCVNSEEVCRAVLGSAVGPNANLEAAVEHRIQDLGDGTTAHVFEHRTTDETYVYRPSFHFELDAERCVLIFDGEGVPSRYATKRPRVNGRYQIERVQEADIPGVYRKRVVESWFWNGERYALAFTRTTIGGAAESSLNGATTQWNQETAEAYRSAGTSWTHRVKAGETLSAISKRYGVPVRELMRQNGLSNAHRLKLGRTIRYDSWKASSR